MGRGVDSANLGQRHKDPATIEQLVDTPKKKLLLLLGSLLGGLLGSFLLGHVHILQKS